ncbi:nineteen complex-related protein 2-domain-containing protein [Schizophyllum amplum]|uniref:Nineteen complex-related protein 2-domain-containing protein n=1 Tax=Schizophyllum amplum TaxID=97359 RepID=A0A550CHA6_9AGAR|nr:nineteen complex-related protein 2-domain-containing protein [Auriculariopsis ampla]
MSLFKKKGTKPALRTRLSEAAPEDSVKTPEDDATMGDESPSAIATKLKKQAKKAKVKTPLSFGAEEQESEGTEFKIRKSNLSQKLKNKAALPSNLDQASITAQSTGPRYDQNYLNELKANTPTSRPSFSADAYDADMAMDVDAPNDIVSVIDVDALDDIAEHAPRIPTETSVKAAKERRERSRKTGTSTSEDYISLSLVHQDSEYQGPHPTSRLMREDDDLGEGDDEFAEFTSAKERIALGKKSRKVEASKRREDMQDLIADAEEEDEETMEWEQEQIRRGGQLPNEAPGKPAKQVYKPAPIPPSVPIPALAPALARLTQQLAQLTASHATTTSSLNAVAKERDEIEEREKEMRDMVERAEAKRAWFDEFREWVESVAGFLDEKYPALERVEEDQLALFKERSGIVAKRRQEEDTDDLVTFLGPAPSSSEEPSSKSDRQARRTTRLGRRQRRHVRNTNIQNEEEGYSTDSSLPEEDASAYDEALQSLKKSRKDVLADVRAEEFRDPGRGRWGSWREQYADTYVGAWGGLGVVSAWEFWVRLEIADWDPVENPLSLDTFKWYKGLYEYARPGSGDVEARDLGPDGDLVSSMITTAVIPRLAKVLEGGALDVYSEKHVRRVIDLVEEVEASIERGSPKLQVLQKAVLGVFARAVAEAEGLLAPYKAQGGSRPFDPEAIPARRRYIARQMKLLKNLLRWRRYMQERYGVGALVERLVEGIILYVAEGGWEVGGADFVEQVVFLACGSRKMD